MAAEALVANSADNMGLSTLFINGITHGFAVDRQRFILQSKLSVPLTGGFTALLRINAS
jgi:hypothetical protein